MTTERLDLRAVSPSDVDDLFAITSDPQTWRHNPELVHREPARTADWISRAAARWDSDGLSYWLVRVGDAVVGIGGVQRQSTGNWNLYYRFAPSAWGNGYATELGRAAIAAARSVDDGMPVIAWISPDNPESIAVAERLGLHRSGMHPDPSDGRMRIAFADRPLATL